MCNPCHEAIWLVHCCSELMLKSCVQALWVLWLRQAQLWVHAGLVDEAKTGWRLLQPPFPSLPKLEEAINNKQTAVILKCATALSFMSVKQFYSTGSLLQKSNTEPLGPGQTLHFQGVRFTLWPKYTILTQAGIAPTFFKMYFREIWGKSFCCYS